MHVNDPKPIKQTNRNDKMGRGLLIQKIKTVLSDPSKKPSEVHNLIALSDVQKIYTTNYDNLIEDAFRYNLKKRCNKIVNGEQLAQALPVPSVVKICGDIDQSDFIVTWKDYLLFRDQKKTFMRS